MIRRPSTRFDLNTIVFVCFQFAQEFTFQLNLERNKLTVLTNLPSLGALRILKLRGNSLSRMDGLQALHSLEYLDSM
jgi:Leucine-rich repeat (LRR) protein